MLDASGLHADAGRPMAERTGRSHCVLDLAKLQQLVILTVAISTQEPIAIQQVDRRFGSP